MPIASVIRTSHLLCCGAIVALLAGCTMGWVKPGASPDQVREDNVECYAAAAAQYPASIVRAHSLFSGGPARDEDANARAREEAVKLCLRQKGYLFGAVH